MIDQLSAPAHQGGASDDQQLPPAPTPAPASAPAAAAHEEGGASDDQQLEDKENQQVKKELQKCVKDRRFLVVVENGDHPSPWIEMKEILDSSGCSPGSAIMVTTKDGGLAKEFSPNRTKTHSFVEFCLERAKRLVSVECHRETGAIYSIQRVLQQCDPDLFCMKLLLGTLHANPYTGKKQLDDLCTSLESPSPGQSQSDPDGSKRRLRVRMKMMKFCYDKLPEMDKSCLLYLSIFAPNSNIRRASLVRRWVAEGHVTQGDGREALDRAEICFEDLLAQGFVDITKTGNLGNVISCKVQNIIYDFITKAVKDENFGDAGLPAKLASHISISSDIQWNQVSDKQKQQQKQGRCNCFSSATLGPQAGAPDQITSFLEWLPVFSRVTARVKVMDLNFCKQLENRHLKIICSNLLKLKYLSMVSTEISVLPRKINMLDELETLDIRQTKVPSSATEGLFLPMLKHLLAGPVGYQVSASPEEELSTVWMPRDIGSMTNMETLRHVQVLEGGDEFKHIENLKHLKNLGVVIYGTQDNVNHLLRVVTLSEHLRRLSVWASKGSIDLKMDLGLSEEGPKLLESISINGITTGLPEWIQKLPHLAEIILRKTSLADNSIRILGQLVQLRCLTLRHDSYTENNLPFIANEFMNIQFLVIEGASNIKRIKFFSGTAPKLEKIVWTFTSMDISQDTITGLSNLPSLKELEVNGEFDPYHVEQAVALHPNCPVFSSN
ncbi:hypothetical protein CFC21_020879 [Triticum aestivum]|uniref:NB-ARC domain-containing protein n=2 Tax=Triticum aestivum TaxID=4565 RepID=A0A9R1E8G7_WHEAT|nr:hypothetical protein CFC21_020879 [Triticum aestivum]